jgi:hypothetical protein
MKSDAEIMECSPEAGAREGSDAAVRGGIAGQDICRGLCLAMHGQAIITLQLTASWRSARSCNF